MEKITELRNFLDSAHSVYHAVAGLVWDLEAAGYTCLSEGKAGSWSRGEVLPDPGGQCPHCLPGAGRGAHRIFDERQPLRPPHL